MWHLSSKSCEYQRCWKRMRCCLSRKSAFSKEFREQPRAAAVHEARQVCTHPLLQHRLGEAMLCLISQPPCNDTSEFYTISQSTRSSRNKEQQHHRPQCPSAAGRCRGERRCCYAQRASASEGLCAKRSLPSPSVLTTVTSEALLAPREV